MLRILKGENDLSVNIEFNKKVRLIASIIETDNKELFNKKANAKTLKQLLNTAISLTKEDYLKIYPPKDYLVSNKADGFYAIMILESSVATMLYKATSIIEYKTKHHYDGMLIVEGEYIEHSNSFVIFDVLHIAKKNINYINELVARYNNTERL